MKRNKNNDIFVINYNLFTSLVIYGT